MQKKTVTPFGTLLFVTLMGGALGACGGSGGSVSTGLPRDVQLKALTSSDLKTACVNTFKNNPETSEAVLRADCVEDLSRDGQAACDSGLAACVTAAKAAAAQRTTSVQCDAPSATDTTRFASCAATVGEFEDCLSETYDTYEKAAASVTCASPKLSVSITPFGGPACVTFTSKCPGVLTDIASPG